MEGSEEELKSVLMRVKEENEIADLKLNIQKTKIEVQFYIMPFNWDLSNVFFLMITLEL